MKSGTTRGLLTVLIVLWGCGRDVSVIPLPEEPPDHGVLSTAAGPVDVLSVREGEDGVQEVSLHHRRFDGRHVVRTLEIRSDEGPEGDVVNAFRLVGDGITVAAIEQRAPAGEGGRVETEIACGDERLTWAVERVGGRLLIGAVHTTGSSVSELSRGVDPSRLADPVYLASVRRAFAALAPSGPLRSDPDLLLLNAVLESDGWVSILTPGDGSDADVEEKFRRLCAAATTISKLSCLASKFLPAAWVLCVPSTGISLACLMYQVYREFVNPDPDPCPCPCMCPSPD